MLLMQQSIFKIQLSIFLTVNPEDENAEKLETQKAKDAEQAQTKRDDFSLKTGKPLDEHAHAEMDDQDPTNREEYDKNKGKYQAAKSQLGMMGKKIYADKAGFDDNEEDTPVISYEDADEETKTI